MPSDRQPRLVLRFAVVTALGLALAGALILAVVREIDQRQAVRSATDRAHFVAETFLRGVIRPADALAPVRGKRRSNLDRLMRRYVLIDGALRVSVDRSDQQDHVLDRSPADRHARRRPPGSGGGPGRLDPVPRRRACRLSRGGGSVKALVSSLPVSLARGKVAVVSIEQNYAPIAANARESLFPVAGVLELALLLLFVLLLPALGRTSRRLKSYVEEIRYQSRHDALTGLSNREALHENVTAALQARADGEHVAVLLIDLDRFKEVNDSLGHDAGDELLCELARRLVEVAGDAPVSRLGGDEFAIVLAGNDPVQGRRVRAGAAAQHRGSRLDPRHPCVGRREHRHRARPGRRKSTSASSSAGPTSRCTSPSRHGPASSATTRRPDRNDASKLVLMIGASRGGRARRARGALSADRPHEPRGTLSKVEALVRWRHPTKGMLQPGSFIPLAEHTRLVIALNRFVLAESVRQCGIWRQTRQSSSA